MTTLRLDCGTSPSIELDSTGMEFEWLTIWNVRLSEGGIWVDGTSSSIVEDRAKTVEGRKRQTVRDEVGVRTRTS